MPSLTAEEVRESVAVMKRKKDPGLDDMPIEIFRAPDTALDSLVDLLINVWDSESLPTDIALGEMLMMHKKGTKMTKGTTGLCASCNMHSRFYHCAYCVESCLM